MERRIEVCANSALSAYVAQRAGAYRVELCAGIPEGGTTPSMGEIAIARELLTTTRLNVIIRPRGGDFLYLELEQEIMLRDIEMCKTAGVDGVVFGCLTAEGDVDMVAMKRMMEAAKGMDVTFHRAFDMCRDPRKALEDIISLGCNRILTSGQAPTAEQGIDLIAELVKQADGRIIIMPGCGVRPNNIRKIADATGATEFHSSARSSMESGMVYRNPAVSMGGTVVVDEYRQDVTDPHIVHDLYEALKS